MEVLYKRGQSCLYFPRRLRSFNSCRPLLRSFYQIGGLFFGDVYWGEGARTADKNRLNKLIRKMSSTTRVQLDTVLQVAEVRISFKLATILKKHFPPTSCPKCHNPIVCIDY